MKPVPKARQTSAPGARFVSGRLLNQICEALQARTPLNAEHATAAGYTGSAKQGGNTPPPMQIQPRFDPRRTYVVPPATVAKWAADLKARMPADATTRDNGINTSAAGLDALLRAVVDATPDASTATAPEGYRLPLPAQPRTARLVIELETKTVYADLCSLDVHLGDETYVTKQTTVNVFEHGTKTNTATAAGNIRTWTDSDGPTTCDAPVYDDDTIPGFDYGAFVSSSYTEETTPFSDVWAAAVAALPGTAAATPTPAELTWPESIWQATTAPGGWSYGLGGIGTFMDVVTAGLVHAGTFRWRVKNTGQCHIKLFWERRLQSDNSLLASDSINLGRGITSAWQTPPTTPADPADLMYVTLSAIQLGPYR